MQLSKENLEKIKTLPDLSIPDKQLLHLPEKVLQFGTGVLLRGLPDYFIDKANKQGLFNGRVVVIKSTDKGGADAFGKQDGLYTLCTRGTEDGIQQESYSINASISRVLSASSDWDAILQCAHNPDMSLIVSNTTEVGITLSDDDVHARPPASFPGKLLAFLYARYKAFKDDTSKGMVIVPTELIVDNGSKLRTIILTLAEKNKLEKEFITWLQQSNHFCNSLVDRIVPGSLPPADKKIAEEKLGYTDELMIMAENFRLWAIESADEKVKNVLSFSACDEGVAIAADIDKFRELKLRILNGTHSFSAGLALLAGFTTVKEAMSNEQMLGFVQDLMMQEIAVATENDTIPLAEAREFARKVTDRFRNPFLEHKWVSITMNYTSKMRMRTIPLLQWYHAKTGKVPAQMALGFAAYLVFMKGEKGEDGRYYHHHQDQSWPIDDEAAGYFAEQWEIHDTAALVDTVLSNENLWGANLTVLPGFAQVVKENIRLIERDGVFA